MERASGILLHITSLHGGHGIGALGKAAHDFIDFCAAAGQRYWQVLPLCPTGYGDSPYQSLSSFAKNPYMIDLDELLNMGLLDKKELPPRINTGRVDFGELFNTRGQLLYKAYLRGKDSPEFLRFEYTCEKPLKDFALYFAIKQKLDFAPLDKWDESIRLRDKKTLDFYTDMLFEEFRAQLFYQFLFDTQWNALKSYAKSAGVKLIGDLPMYVPFDSADVWSAPEQFLLNSDGKPLLVAGVPPDYFSETGQLWGNPLYNLEYMEKDGFSWWLSRAKAAAANVDCLRIDHFRALASYWAIDASSPDASHGHWEKGPGEPLIDALKAALPDTQIIAEDLGAHGDDVDALLRYSGYPGMSVLEFAFDGSPQNPYLPHNLTRNSVMYTGTHDNAPLLAWERSLSQDTHNYICEYLGQTLRKALRLPMLRAAAASVCDLNIIQMQDIIGDKMRMNLPGTLGNWSWRMRDYVLSPRLAAGIARFTKLYNR